MSERKTTEIKLRVTPAEKTSWQFAAEQREVGLSQFIRDCVSESLWADQNRRMDGSSLIDNAIDRLREIDAEDSSVAPAWRFEAPTTFAANVLAGYGTLSNLTDVSPQEDVPTSDEGDSVARPWTFEARNSG